MFITPYTFDKSSKFNFEAISVLPHETVPDMSFTIPQLMQRFASGNDPLISKKPIYDENANFDSFDVTRDPAFDLADYTALQHDLRSRKVSVPTVENPPVPSEAEAPTQTP